MRSVYQQSYMCIVDLSRNLQTRDLAKLKESIQTINKKGFDKILTLKVSMAQRIIKTLQHMESIKAEVEALDRKVLMAEIKKMAMGEPSDDVMSVLTSTCDLLGLDGSRLQVRVGYQLC
jgi:hypothetical protein